MEKKEVPESGGMEQPSHDSWERTRPPRWILRAILITGVALLLLPVLIPLVAVLGTMAMGLFGIGLGLVLSLMAVALRLVLLGVQLFFGLLGLLLTTLPWILAVFGVLYLMEKLDQAEE